MVIINHEFKKILLEIKQYRIVIKLNFFKEDPLIKLLIYFLGLKEIMDVNIYELSN